MRCAGGGGCVPAVRGRAADAAASVPSGSRDGATGVSWGSLKASHRGERQGFARAQAGGYGPRLRAALRPLRARQSSVAGRSGLEWPETGVA